MSSTIAWLDHSESQRRRMMEVVNLFRERDTVDDLGFAGVRDAMSELLFPGLSVLHTRAGYLLFIPWIYQELERQRLEPDQIGTRAREREIWLIKALTNGGETEGVIGREAGENLRRLPSMAYWNALHRFGIRLFPGSREQYHRAIERRHRGTGRRLTSDDGDPITGPSPTWHPDLPQRRPHLLSETTFSLSRDEAAYLRDRLCAATPGSLLGFLLSDPAHRADASWPWSHPAVGDAPARLQQNVHHAERFSLIAQGAQLHYNLLLARRAARLRREGAEPDAGDELIDHYREAIDAWRADLDSEWAAIRQWNLDDFWQTARTGNPRLTPSTAAFAHWWIERVRHDPHQLETDDVAARFRDREHRLKGALARLSNLRPLERWSGASSTGRLAFRWGSVRPVVDDVLAGLERA
jgi:hypothetical protein